MAGTYERPVSDDQKGAEVSVSGGGCIRPAAALSAGPQCLSARGGKRGAVAA